MVNRVALGSSEAKAQPFYSHGETMHPRKVLHCGPFCSCRTAVDVTTLDRYCETTRIPTHPDLNSASAKPELAKAKEGGDSDKGSVPTKAKAVGDDVLEGPTGSLTSVTVDLMNVSVSGHEVEVLRGSSETLLRTRFVLLEYGGTYIDSGAKLADALALLSKAGLGFLCLVAPHRLVPVDSKTAVREDGALRYYLASRSKQELAKALTPMPAQIVANDPRFGLRFAHVPTLPHVHEADLKLDPPGFNLCLQSSGNGYFGLVRRTRNPNGEGWGNHMVPESQRRYPETENHMWCLRLDSDLKLVPNSELELKDLTDRTKHRSFSTGPEDCRLLERDGDVDAGDDCCALGTTLDTNPNWQAEMSFLRFSPSKRQITNVTPLKVTGLPSSSEKNWLTLRRWGDELHVLHHANPLRVLRINVKTGESAILREKRCDALNFRTHSAASLRLPSGHFLILVREFRRILYVGSRWLLLDDRYRLVGVSPPFRFQNIYYYEMCMSITLTPQGQDLAAITSSLHDGMTLPHVRLVAAVSLEDRVQRIYTFLLPTVLQTLVPLIPQ